MAAVTTMAVEGLEDTALLGHPGAMVLLEHLEAMAKRLAGATALRVVARLSQSPKLKTRSLRSRLPPALCALPLHQPSM